MRCRYKRKIFQNEQNGYTIAVYSTQDNTVPLAARDKYWTSQKQIVFTAIGFGLPLTDEIELEVEGDWESNEHGLQFKVENFMEIVPRTREGIIGYLSSGAIKGVGPKTAEAIFQKFGIEALEVMEEKPEQLLKIRGISEKKLADIQESFGKNKVFRELMTFLAPFHVSAKKVNMILQKFRDESINIIRNKPYMLCAVQGFGFLTVDAIGRQLCSAMNDPMRISGCIGYVLNEGAKEGNLYLEQSVLILRALEVLNKDLHQPAVTEEDINQVLYRLVLQQSVVLDEDRIYITKKFEEENETAAMIAKHLLWQEEPLNIECELEMAQRHLGITLSDQQKKAVRMVFQSHMSIITGGPGTGKTTVLKVILFIYELRYKTKAQLMAPTGRAARRMAESTGYEEASTMHMALGLLGEFGGMDAGIECLTAGFENVDEVSMVDMYLIHEFMQRVPETTKILLLGDVKQLPSVGAGDVFRELISCGLIPVTVLDLVYRQGTDSNIPVNAQLMQENRTDLHMGDDFQFIPCVGAQNAAEIVSRLYLQEIARHGIEQVQILTPYRKRSAAGVEELNKSLQDMVNSPTSGKKELVSGNMLFRAGDRILQNKNTDLASNGDLGTILDFFEDEDGNCKALIAFSDDRQVEYDSDQMDMVEHANAITIHKAQGSECLVVIIPWVKAFYRMLKRNILYTAITRAKAKVYLVGEWNAVCQAIHTDDTGKRNTILGQRIVRYYNQYSGKPEDKMEQLRLAV